MRICAHCQTENAHEHDFCVQCGQPFPKTIVYTAQTIQARAGWKGQAGADRGVRRSIALGTLFSGRDSIVIGRFPETDIYLPHPIISRSHAEVTRTTQGLVLRDLNSVNGVFLNGKRVREPVPVKDQDRIGVGPYMFALDGERFLILDNSQSLRLQARNLEKYVRDPKGQPRKLLDNISLVLEPGEFVSLLGPSGSGKSTLMDCLNGRRPATSGVVLANGENFYQHYKSFRQSLGYVPQQDIVHTQLTVYRALLYTALLRLPLDTDEKELRARITEVMQMMELVPHQNTLIRNLSGGQIKRVSLGAELIARPCLLYIDEATSGLDAGTEARMMRLFRTLADEGKSIVCITHNVDNVDLCDLILVLMRGKLIYYGPPAEARPYFGVQRISEIYDRLATQEASLWEKQFRQSELYRTFVAKRLEITDRSDDWKSLEAEALGAEREAASGTAAAGSVFTPLIHLVSSMRQPRLPKVTWLHQLLVLTQRNLDLIWRDKGVLRLLALQAPVVALFVLLGFISCPFDQRFVVPRPLTENEHDVLHNFNRWMEKNYPKYQQEIEQLDTDKSLAKRLALLREIETDSGPIMPEGFIVSPRYTYMLLFLCGIVVLWFGCNNAAKEIVKEDAIYSRERAVNLGYVPYLASKFLVWSAISVLQALLFLLCVYGPMEFLHWWQHFPRPRPEYQLDYPTLGLVFSVLAMAGVALGLLLSACVRTPDKVNTLLPYVLLPQIILGGGVLTIADGVLFYTAAVLSPTYWAFRAARTGETTLPEIFGKLEYEDTIWLPLVALLVQTAILLLLTAWFLRRKDKKKG